LTAYQHNPEDPRSLGSNMVMALLEDTHGAVWVGTHGGGLGRLDPQTGEFTWYSHRTENPESLSSNNVTALFEDAQGILWIGTESGGLNALNPSNRVAAFVRYQHDGSNPHSLSHDYVMTLLEDAAGVLWVGTGRGLNELDRQSKRFRRHYHEEGDLYSLSHSEILSLTEDAQGLLWIGTRMGLNKFDKSTRAFGHIRGNQETLGALSSNYVTTFLEDTQGTLWIGTYPGGLHRSTTDEALTGFVHFDHREDDPHSLAERQAVRDVDHLQPLGDDGVMALCEDVQGRLWIGTVAGLHRLVPGKDLDSPPTFLRYQCEQDDPFSLSHNLVLALTVDGMGNLWIGTYRGLNRLDQADASQGFVRYQHEEDDPHSISHDHVRSIQTDAAGNVWIGTNGGLNRIAPGDDSRFIRYQHDEQDPHSLSHDGVNCICEDAQGNLWIGTWAGLNRLDPQTGRFTAYREKDGLSNDVVYGLLIDDQGCLWLSTNGGINRFDPATERFTHYDVHDGVQANEFTDGAFYKDRLGRLYFGGVNGFNVFNSADIRENTYLPPVVLTNFLLANQPVPISESGPLKEHITFAEQIELAPEEHVFAFEFSALNYRQTHKNRFAYRLEGFDPDWIYTGARDRKAVYTNVPPGSYTFRVKAANDDGLWNEKGTSIQVTVSQPWWHIVFSSAFEAVVIHEKGTILKVNQAALELYGYEQAELAGQSIYRLMPPEERDQVAERITMGDETPYESKGVRKDGSVFVSEVRARAIPYQGRLVRVAAIRDITDRKRAAQALQQSEAKFRGFVEQSSDGIFVVDEEGTIIEWNRSLEEITGLARQEALGAPAWDVQYHLVTDEQKTPETRERFKAIMLEALQTGETPWLDETVLAVYRRTDGATRLVEQRLFPIRTEQGFRLGGISADITARRAAEAQLRTLSRAVEQSDSTIVVTDLEGAIEFVNPAFSRITGYSAQEVLGQNPRLLKSGKMPEQVYVDLWQTIASGRVWEGELLNKKKDGTYYWEWAIISPVRDEAGTPTHYVAVKQDITDRKQAERALEQRVRHEKALAACSRSLLKGNGPQPVNQRLLHEALAPLLEAVQASRAYVSRNVHDPETGLFSSMVAEAVAPRVRRNLENPDFQRIPWSSAPEQIRLALEASQSCGGATEELFASTPELLDTLLEQSVLSAQLFPIHFGDEWWGYVGFDDCQTVREWDPQEIMVLRTASRMIASALQRWHAEASLQQAHDELEQRVRARTAELDDAIESLRREVEQRQQAETETREQLVVQQGLAAISTRLMQAIDSEPVTVGVLAQTGALFGVERVFLVRLQRDGQAVHRIHEWCAPGVAPLFDSVEGWTLSGASGWLEELRERGWFYSDDRAQIPYELQDRVPLFGGDAGGGYCAVPVYARQELIGFLGCHGLAPAGQDLEQQRQVLEVIVGLLGSAWLREWVLETLDQRIAARTRQLSTFFDLTSLAISVQELSEMLEAIPGRILELGSCDALCIHLLDEEKTTLILGAQGNLPPGSRQRLQAIALESDFLRFLNQFGEPIALRGQAGTGSVPAQLHLEGFPSYLGVPLPGGWVSYYRATPHGFSLDESSLLLALAEQVGVSVENYRLRRRIGEVAVLEERQRLARDLHDSVTQSLYLQALYAGGGRDAVRDGDLARAIDLLTELESNALQALREMRLLLYELRPQVLEQEGLIRTLERRFDAVERRADTNATVICQAGEELNLPHTLERELYYVAIEALNNTLKYADATVITVRVEIQRSELCMEISDNGCGFDPQRVSHGLGLHAMQWRIERLGGRLQIVSEPGAGTRVVAWLDLGAT
jgi:PAS domain S-box-containing protein